MDIELVSLIASLGGGAFGAAIGGQPAFIFTGFCVLVGVAVKMAGVEFDFLGEVAFGPMFGPHISFAGGVAAVSYAADTHIDPPAFAIFLVTSLVLLCQSLFA